VFYFLEKIIIRCNEWTLVDVLVILCFQRQLFRKYK
jgi:hypothetical protein